jgi:hypothetical protein
MSYQQRTFPKLNKYRSGQRLTANTINKLIDAVSIVDADTSTATRQFIIPQRAYSFGIELLIVGSTPTVRVYAGSIVIHGYGTFTTGGNLGYTELPIYGTPYYVFAKCPRTGGAATIDWANERPSTTLDEYRFGICKIEIGEHGVYELTQIFRQGDIDLDTPIR